MPSFMFSLKYVETSRCVSCCDSNWTFIARFPAVCDRWCNVLLEKGYWKMTTLQNSLFDIIILLLIELFLLSRSIITFDLLFWVSALRETLGFGKWMRVISEADGLHKPGAMLLLCAQMVAVNSLSPGNFYRPFCTSPTAWSTWFYIRPLHLLPLLSTHACSRRPWEVTRA